MGQTSQLAVTTAAGATVTSSVTWQTSAATVATVSQAGLVTATGFGTATITAATSGAKGTQIIDVVQEPAGTTTISACQAITSPGSYALNTDLVPVGLTACLTLVGVSAVQVDCRGHAVPGVLLSNAQTVTISNCAVAYGPNQTSQTTLFEMFNVNTVSVTNCTMNLPVTISGGTHVTLLQDAIVASSPTPFNFVLLLQNGTNNQVIQSTISSGYDGSSAEVGADDGILLENETGDTIQGNRISNVFDAGIEGVDAIINTTLSGNMITNVGSAGIASYWCTSWTNDTIRLNSVSQAPILFNAVYGADLTKCGGVGPAENFTNNSFIGNRFRNPIQGILKFTFGPGLEADFAAGTVSGNVLQGNDFGTQGCAFLVPAQGFTDGGGNICTPSGAVASSPARAARGPHGHVAAGPVSPGGALQMPRRARPPCESESPYAHSVGCSG